MTTETAPVLQGIELKKTYRSKDRTVEALKGVSFGVMPGEIFGIVGESGSGKSTLLRMISGIEHPDSGRLLHNGIDYTGSTPGQTGRFLQVIFQDAYGSFDPHLTMRKSLMECSNATMSEAELMIKKVGLDVELLDRRPKLLSGGQCQRMAIARALLTHGDILLCDEITSALDVTTQAQVVELITDLNSTEDVAIVFVSHDIALVSNICNRIMVLNNGDVVDEGITSEVIAHPTHEYTKRLLDAVI
ncbi:MAG: ATP-binding cassette domain-containing protein [Lachnospiraceae bacterium]|nr:ATP-binding cassette domain-containing protein [Lachnospiraceae bacterium]